MAAAVALQAGFDAPHALRLLELGRQVITRSLASLRPDMSELTKQHPDLAEEFVRLRRKIEIPGIFKNISFVNLSSENTSELFFKEANEAQAELAKLITGIRTLDGFQNFLLPPDATEMAHAGDKGPVIVVNTSAIRCDAFIIHGGKIEVLPLPKMDVDELETRVRLGTARHRHESHLVGDIKNLLKSSTIEWLWDVVAGPVLDKLGFADSSTNLTLDELPRVWWIPTGLLGRLPIHAAGYHDQNGGRNTVLHKVISSHSTSVTSLLTARRNPIGTCTTTPTTTPPDSSKSLDHGNPTNKQPQPQKLRHALLIAMSQTPNQRPLPYVSQEIQDVENILLSMGFDTRKPSPFPRKHAVLSRWKSCSIFHFAGHGTADPYNPSQSRLLLHDWQTDPLTVDDLRDGWNRDYSRALNWDDEFLTSPIAKDARLGSEAGPESAAPFLAYLSACSSGTAEVDVLSDEAVHLASAFQLAGFRNVVASLWDVKDSQCARVARTLYSTLAREGLTDDAVARGLHLAVLELWSDEHVVGTGRHGTRAEGEGSTTVVGTTSVAASDRDGDDVGRPAVGDSPAGGAAEVCEEKDGRDAVPVGDDSAKDTSNRDAHESAWVPFVHFGV